MGQLRQAREAAGRADPRRHPHARLRDRPRDHRVPPHREGGAEGRARSPPGEEGDGGSQPPPRHLHRQEVHEPRPAVPRPHPGRQHRPDEGGRQVRVSARLQVLHLRDVVDPAGHHPLDRRPGAHYPHPRAYDRDDQQDRAHEPPDAARDRPRADAGGTLREARHAAREGAQGAEDRQGADLARDADRRRRGQPPRRLHRGPQRGAADRCGDPVEPARDDDARAGLAHAARGTRAAHALRHRHEHRPHAGRSRPAVLGDARTHPSDRGQGAAQAQAPEPQPQAPQLPG